MHSIQIELFSGSQSFEVNNLREGKAMKQKTKGLLLITKIVYIWYSIYTCTKNKIYYCPKFER